MVIVTDLTVLQVTPEARLYCLNHRPRNIYPLALSSTPSPLWLQPRTARRTPLGAYLYSNSFKD